MIKIQTKMTWWQCKHQVGFRTLDMNHMINRKYHFENIQSQNALNVCLCTSYRLKCDLGRGTYYIIKKIKWKTNLLFCEGKSKYEEVISEYFKSFSTKMLHWKAHNRWWCITWSIFFWQGILDRWYDIVAIVESSAGKSHPIDSLTTLQVIQ